jgi:Tol biopolymer transport system component
MFSSTWDDWTPFYFPQGDRVALASDRGGTWEVWIADADGSSERRLTYDRHAIHPQWHPDGGRICYSSWPPGEPLSDVYVVDAAGGFERKLTEDEFADAAPCWSADGDWIYFQSQRAPGGLNEIWRMPSEGGGPSEKIAEANAMMPQFHEGRVYFRRGSRIWSAAAGGGDERLVLDVPIGMRDWQLWRNHLVYIRKTGPESAVVEILDLETSDTRELTTLEVDPNATAGFQTFLGLTVSPDGQYILFSRKDTAGSDLVLVDNYR